MVGPPILETSSRNASVTITCEEFHAAMQRIVDHCSTRSPTESVIAFARELWGDEFEDLEPVETTVS
jgi:hypothetical protein